MDRLLFLRCGKYGEYRASSSLASPMFLTIERVDNINDACVAVSTLVVGASSINID